MKAEYKRNYNRSYMILEDDGKRESYEEKMVRHNHLRSLLVLQIMASDEKRQFWYDITGRDSLKNYMDFEKLGFTEMENLIQHLIYAVEEAQEYLLDPGHILLSAEGIFFDRSTLIPAFAYFPFEEGSFQDGLRSLMEELLRNMDHQEPEFVSVMYEIYAKLLSDNFTLEEMLGALKEKNPGRQEEAKYEDVPFLTAPLDNASGKRKQASKAPEKLRDIEGDQPDDMAEDFREYDFELPKSKKPGFFGFGKPGRSERNGSDGRSERSSGAGRVEKIGGIARPAREKPKKRKRDEELVMYIEDEALIPEESHETVLLSGSFLTEPSFLRYQGSHAQADLTIDRDSILVGSAREKNDEVINSSAVSKHHARITRKGEMLFLEDLNSTNGTYVNGEALTFQEKRLIKKNDKIHFADEMFVLE